ncbi:hypothetical protein CDL15_Pgr010443 [Punica granatum]|uniref:Uncharacterized protein n=1 Tax=Punica granatum TaxID=22663 RepID=A0A218VW30_PUNGR|nr:hypothetical protein CDL15_Pgr010443 [Punica granatum]PKI36962.1 hypothetical protein CRG98_042663 [Punica granatum]
MTMTRCEQQFEEHKITSVNTTKLEDGTTSTEEEVREGLDTMPPDNTSDPKDPPKDLPLNGKEFEDVDFLEILKWLDPTKSDKSR